MNFLGLSAHYHDASAALTRDGELVATVAEERLSRLKHDPNHPKLAIRYCMEHAGLTVDDLEGVFFYEEPHTKFTRVLVSTLGGFPRTAGRFVQSMRDWLGDRLWLANNISKALDIHPDRVHFVPHHVSHASQAFLGSPFDRAAILTVDAVGEWASTSLAVGSWANPAEIRVLETLPYPHSLGLFYAAFTAFLGFRPNDGECSTMALAAFGHPNRVEDVRRVLRIQSDGTYELDADCFDFTATRGSPFTSRFTAIFGEPRPFLDPLPLSVLGGHDPPSQTLQGYLDLAASVQVVLEEALMGLANRLHRLAGVDNLCLAGGVALNCVANSRLFHEGPFTQIFVPPDPGDGGGAAGAAMFGAWQAGCSQRPRYTPYLGPQDSAQGVPSWLEHVEPESWKAGSTGGGATATQVVAEQLTDSAIVERAVEDLAAGRIVGWFQGRMESGPRALGNRSILVDPTQAESCRRLSDTVKKRASFRPYALSIAEEDAHRVLDLPQDIPHMARWMQMVCKVQDDGRERIPSAQHIDGTTRPQVCQASANPRYHALLRAHAENAQTPGLLNTSFNERGYPIVASRNDALLMFARTPMDTLVVDNVLVRKV